MRGWLQGLAFVVAGCGAEAPGPTFTVVTFNTGTNPGLAHDAPPDDGYTSQHAERSDLFYGDGMAWLPAIEATRAFLAEVAPEVVGFQEIFDPAECPSVPLDARGGFVCESWGPGAPSVAELAVGAGYQVMCHAGHTDKCLAVRETFGAFRGCASTFCAEGAYGTALSGCGGGARVGRAVIDRVDGTSITVVNVHGTSGFSTEDQACRVRQVEQVFLDLGDGAPAASGAVNVILGDLNTDPGRLADADTSAQRWLDFAGPPGAAAAFHFISPIGESTEPSYGDVLDIDHVLSDQLAGACWVAGLADRPAVTSAIYFDHKPVVCAIELPR